MWGNIQNMGSIGGGIAISATNLPFNDSAALHLPQIPENANSAIVVLEADPTSANPAKAAHFTQNKFTPNAGLGLSLGDGEPFEIIGRENLAAFRIIGLEAGKNHTLQIEYYS